MSGAAHPAEAGRSELSRGRFYRQPAPGETGQGGGCTPTVVSTCALTTYVQVGPTCHYDVIDVVFVVKARPRCLATNTKSLTSLMLCLLLRRDRAA